MKKEIEEVAPELVENKVKVISNFFDINKLFEKIINRLF